MSTTAEFVLEPSFSPGYAGFIEGFDVVAESVDKTFYDEYFEYNLWLYDGPYFEVVQLVYPNTSGVWPWEQSASAWFRSWQPVLTVRPVGQRAL
jgi:hypothetical protein